MKPTGKPKSPWLVALERELADGDWHDREEVVLRVMPHVIPLRALHQRERNIAGKRKVASAVDRTREDAIRIGAKLVVQEMIRLRCEIQDGKIKLRPAGMKWRSSRKKVK